MTTPNPSPNLLPVHAVARWLWPAVRGLSIAIALAVASFAGAADAGSLSGAVSNTATGNLLEGARVAVPQLGVSALTDNTGRYVISNLPPGTHELVVTYVGLDPVRSTVTVTAGRRGNAISISRAASISSKRSR